jgi:hypothetical protein
MKSRYAILTVFGVVTAFIATPASLHGVRQAPAAEHEQHHPDAPATPERATTPTSKANMMGMMASDAKLDELVKKMNAAKGAAKTDAMAELLTALVQNHRTMCGSMMTNMSSMMDMMKMMDSMGGRGAAGAPTPSK